MTGADVPAGGFSSWLTGMQAALRGEQDADVPCGDCTACCTSSQFVHVGPDETAALATIPRELLFPAPGRPGYLVLGYDEHGRCPMLVDGRCSIYEHRPRTCRVYDCRVFAAAGLEPGGAQKVRIAERVRRWRFDHPTAADRAAHDEIRTTAAALLAGGTARDATEAALLAIERADP